MNKAELGKRIAKVRQHLGLSQAQFALSINRSPGLISKVEKGRSSVSEETIKVIVKVCGVNEEWLLSGEGEMFSKETYETDRAGVGKRVEEARRDNHLTQKEFASKIGYTTNQIGYVEIGKVNPSRQFLRKVALCFSIGYDWLLTGRGE